MHRSQKAATIETIEAQIRATGAIIVTDYRGLTVDQIRRLRVDLGPLDATLRVAKNTLARIAAQNAGVDDLVELLRGPTAIAFCHGDPAPVARKLADVARETRILTLKGGLVEGQRLNEAAVVRLATLPPKDALRAQFVGTVQAPLVGFVSLLAQAAREFVVVLDQIIQAKQQQEAASAS
jgi:large subunit ribosomal protein L10